MSTSAPETDLAQYYGLRAHEYEAVYAKPERQVDIAQIQAWLPGAFEGRDGLELACGTGFWTPFAARRANRWLATDLNEETLALARRKPVDGERVHFERRDAYAPWVAPTFDAAFAGFWWSHVPLDRLRDWLAALHSGLRPGARVVLMDNRYVEGSNHPIHRRDAQGNTYQLRRLADGSQHEVLKNFPTQAEALAVLGPQASAVQWTETTYYWLLCYTWAPEARG